MLVEGEAGIGKSWLMSELVAGHLEGSYLAGTILRIAGCHPQADPFPLEPVVEALRDVGPNLEGRSLGAVTATLRPLLPELDPHLPPALEAAVGHPFERHNVFRGLRDLLGALGPTVLVLEDLQWADAATIDLLHFLVTSPLPDLSLVLTYRPDELPPSSGLRSLASRVPSSVGLARIVLSPLDLAGTAALAGALLDLDEVREDMARVIHDRTGGVPAAIAEVLRLVREHRGADPGDGRSALRLVGEIAVPATIRDAVLERLFRLSDQGRLVAFAAAAFGERATEAMLAEVTGLSAADTSTGLSEALAISLLHEDAEGAVDFRHGLARQAVHEAMPGPQRRRLHLRIATALQREPSCSAARLAHHFRESGQMEEWATHAERAADEALARRDPWGATRLLKDLLVTTSPADPDRARLAHKLGRAALVSGGESTAAAVLKEVISDENLTDAERGELRLLLSNALWHLCQPSAAVAELRQCVNELAGGGGLASAAMRGLALLGVPEGHVSDHLHWIDEAARAAQRAGDRAAEAAVLLDRSVILLAIGDEAAWNDHGRIFDHEVAPEDRQYQARAFSRMAEAAVVVGDYDRAGDFVAAARAICEERAFFLPVLTLRATEAYIDWLTGNVEGLEERVQRLIRESDGSPALVASTLVSSLFHLMRGRTAEAEEGFSAASELALQRGLLGFHPAAAAGLARCHLFAGDPEAAVVSATAALDMVRTKGIWVWAAELVPPVVEALVLLGRTGEANDLVAEFADGLAGRYSPAARASLLLSEAMTTQAMGESAAAARGFDAAAVAYAAMPRPLDAALAHERAGRALLDIDRDAAIERLTSAMAVESFGAAADGARIRKLLRDHNVTLPYPWRGGRRSLGQVLSAREAQVLSLVADGLTHRQIGEMLHLSPRTVETHLHRARRKQRMV